MLLAIKQFALPILNSCLTQIKFPASKCHMLQLTLLNQQLTLIFYMLNTYIVITMALIFTYRLKLRRNPRQKKGCL